MAKTDQTGLNAVDTLSDISLMKQDFSRLHLA